VGQPLPPLLPNDAGLPFWLEKRDEIRNRWLEYLGPIERPESPPRTEIVSEERIGNVLRQLIRYESEPGWPTESYIVRPAANQVDPRPGVVVFHSTVEHSIRQPAGVEGKPEKAFGLKLAERGFVTLCPRNFLWPDNHHIDTEKQTALFQNRHPNSKGMAKMLLDAQVAVDLLLSLPGVDRNRIGAIGHSLGAKEVLYLAAFDERIKATVSSEGGIGTEFSNWDAPWYLGPEIKTFATSSHDHHELLALTAPRPFLLVGGESADGTQSWPYVEVALTVYRLYDGTPRIGFLNHKRGHAVPLIAEQRIYDWLEAYLRPVTD
jgi:dienelactone hydrolase